MTDARERLETLLGKSSVAALDSPDLDGMLPLALPATEHCSHNPWINNGDRLSMLRTVFPNPR